MIFINIRNVYNFISIKVGVTKIIHILCHAFFQSSITQNLIQNCDFATNITECESNTKFTTTINSVDGKNAIAAFNNTTNSIFPAKPELTRYVS